MYHDPVLLKESVEALEIIQEGIYVDVTFGGGGHSREIAEHLTTGKLIAFDQDIDAIENKLDLPGFTLLRQNFRFLRTNLNYLGHEKVHGILADLGVSSHQFDEGDRGFSFRMDADLDMRMNQTATISAKLVLNEYAEDELANIFYQYGEIKNSRKVAREVVQSRPLNTIQDFKDAIFSCAPKFKDHQFFAKAFQAIRIEVNQEMKVLKEFLVQSAQVLEKGGKLVVISYHSLEDRLVKNYIKTGNFNGNRETDVFGNVLAPFKAIQQKAIVASSEEIARNNRARSAKMRIAVKN